MGGGGNTRRGRRRDGGGEWGGGNTRRGGGGRGAAERKSSGLGAGGRPGNGGVFHVKHTHARQREGPPDWRGAIRAAGRPGRGRGGGAADVSRETRWPVPACGIRPPRSAGKRFARRGRRRGWTAGRPGSEKGVAVVAAGRRSSGLEGLAVSLGAGSARGRSRGERSLGRTEGGGGGGGGEVPHVEHPPRRSRGEHALLAGSASAARGRGRRGERGTGDGHPRSRAARPRVRRRGGRCFT